MSNLRNTNTKQLPAEGPKPKRARMSPRLQGKHGEKDLVDNLPTDSQPDPTETLDVGHTNILSSQIFNEFFGVKDCYENKTLN